jgi:hypothetical protein
MEILLYTLRFVKTLKYVKDWSGKQVLPLLKCQKYCFKKNKLLKKVPN